MNTLSWLLYIAEVTQSLGNYISFLVFVSFTGLLCWNGLGVLLYNSMENGNRKLLIWPVVLVFFVGILANLLPSKQTIYMIAASEFVDKAIQTEAVKDVFEIVQKEIKKLKDK